MQILQFKSSNGNIMKILKIFDISVEINSKK